jgi:hypothetical protein
LGPDCSACTGSSVVLLLLTYLPFWVTCRLQKGAATGTDENYSISVIVISREYRSINSE